MSYSDFDDDLNSVYRRIKMLVVDRDIRPNEHLALRPVADKFNTSQTTIREVLVRLTVERLVAHVPHRGFYVRALDVVEMKNQYDLFDILLAQSMQIGERNFKIETVKEQCGFDPLETGRIFTSIENDIGNKVHSLEEFYRILANLSQNALVTTLIDQFCSATHCIRQIDISDPERHEVIDQGLAQIILHMTDGEVQKARRLLHEQVQLKIDYLPMLIAQGNAKSLQAPPLYE